LPRNLCVIASAVMKTLNHLLLTVLLLAATPALADSSGITSAVDIGARYHRALPSFVDYPFGDGDFSYGIAYEARDTSGYWQFAVNYSPSPSGSNKVDYVLTPEINLIIQDPEQWKFLRAGIGIMNSYMPSNDTTKDDWLGFYYHVLLGAHVDLGKIGVEFDAYYTFEDFSNFSEFKFDDLEYGLWLSYGF
jgi:hypothetical protein